MLYLIPSLDTLLDTKLIDKPRSAKTSGGLMALLWFLVVALISVTRQGHKKSPGRGKTLLLCQLSVK